MNDLADRFALTSAALIVVFLVGLLIGRETAPPPSSVSDVDKTLRGDVDKTLRESTVSEQTNDLSGLASIGSVLVGALALLLAYRRTEIARHSRVDPLIQAQYRIRAEMVTDLIEQMRRCIRTAQDYSDIAQTHITPGQPKPGPGGAKVTEKQEELLHDRRLLDTGKLKAGATLPDDLVEIIIDFEDQLSKMLRNEFEVAKRGDDMMDTLYGKYYTFMDESKSSLRPDEIHQRSPLS